MSQKREADHNWTEPYNSIIIYKRFYIIAFCIIVLTSITAGITPDVKITFCHFGNDFYSYTIPGARIAEEWQEFNVPRDSFEYSGIDIPGRDTAWAALDLTAREVLTDTQHILIDDITYVIDDTSCIFTLDNFNDPACLETWKFVNGYDNGSQIKWYQSDDTPAADSGKSLYIECLNSLGGLYYCSLGRDLWADHRALVTTPEKVGYSFWLKKGRAGTHLSYPGPERTNPHYSIRRTAIKVYISPGGHRGTGTIRAWTLDGHLHQTWDVTACSEVVWDIRRLPTGIYTIVLDLNGDRFSEKLFINRY